MVGLIDGTIVGDTDGAVVDGETVGIKVGRNVGARYKLKFDISTDPAPPTLSVE